MSGGPLEAPGSSVTSRRTEAAVPAIVLAVAFAVGLLGGFLFTRAPAPPEVRADVVSPSATPARTLRGTLAAVGDSSIEVTTPEGTRRLIIDARVPIDELAPLSGAIPTGVAANVGGNRTENGFVITGVVILEAAR